MVAPDAGRQRSNNGLGLALVTPPDDSKRNSISFNSAIAPLAALKREHISILTTMYGKPFTVDGFSQWMRDAITDAGLSLGCQPHGLRKATGRRLAEAGATAKMIMSVLGHITLAEAERCTEEADQAGLAEDAVIKQMHP